MLTPAQAPGAYAMVNGRRMYYEQHGQGRTILLLHGGVGTIRSSFEHQLPFLAKDHRVLAVEQIGHGHTPDAPIPFSYAQMAEDTAALLRSLKVQSADVIGWSDGGILGLLLARRHPDLVRRVVVSGVNTRLIMTPEKVKEIREATPQQLADDLSPTLKEAYAAVSPDGAAHWPVVAQKVWELWLTPVILEKADLLAIQAPVLLVSGDKDSIPLDHTLENFKALAKGQLLVLPGTKHLTFQTAAAVLNPMILNFLDSPDPAAIPRP
jgi:pimeloyl-ACP methyl ester carboxylesterase